MSANHTFTEKQFEDDIVRDLKSLHGYKLESTASFNKRTGFIDEQVANWIMDVYPDTYDFYAREYAGEFKGRLVSDVRKAIDDKGALEALRGDINLADGKPIRMMGLPDATGTNIEIQKNYKSNKISVIRQLFFDDHYHSIDLAFFLNGVCVFTWEIKHSSKQGITDAIDQYKSDARKPDLSPILRPITGALAHFAVSNQYIYVTTALMGQKTRFLPFNVGTPEGGGNPVNPEGYATSYLWESIFSKRDLLNIISDYMFVEKDAVIFPRYHQIDCVEQMKKSSIELKSPLSGKLRMLIQHSPGSGKTKTIIWLAHHLVRLFDSGKAVFDSVIIVTDRKMLDGQIDGAVRVFDKSEHFERASNAKGLYKLVKEKRNIITTLQKFPHGFKGIKGLKVASKGGRVAIIIDEAHSSQQGKMANTMVEEIAEHMGENMMLFAFTATPTDKTLEIFGEPVHTYTMRQAIAEGFIVDVLRKVTFNKFVFNAKTIETLNSELVDPRDFTSKVFKLAMRSGSMVSIKAHYLMSHFENEVLPKASWAKAMIVASDIQSAIAYKVILDDLIKSKGKDFKSLISFTGKKSHPELGVVDETTSARLCNAGQLRKNDEDQFIRDNFDQPNYKFLIVVDKFTTGFDQPKLAAMYLDKKIEGVHLVQTINRLNRCYQNKTSDTVYVVDLAGNTPESFKKSVEPYYGETVIEDESNISKHMLEAKTVAEIYGLTVEQSQLLVKSENKEAFISVLVGKMPKDAEKLNTLTNSIKFYTENYFYAINVGFPADHQFYRLLKTIHGYLKEHKLQKLGQGQSDALNKMSIENVKHVGSEHVNLCPDEDQALESLGKAPSPHPFEQNLKTVGECLIDLNAKMHAMMSEKGFTAVRSSVSFDEIHSSMERADLIEISRNAIEDIKDSPSMTKIRRYARENGVSDVDDFSLEVLTMIKSSIDRLCISISA